MPTSRKSQQVASRNMFCESISALLSDDGAAFPRNVQINLKEDIVALISSSDTTRILTLVMITHSPLQPHCKDMCCIHETRFCGRRYGKSLRSLFVISTALRLHWEDAFTTAASWSCLNTALNHTPLFKLS